MLLIPILAAFLAASSCANQNQGEDSEASSTSDTEGEVAESSPPDESASSAEAEFDPHDGSGWILFNQLAIPRTDPEWELLSSSEQEEYLVQLVDLENCTETRLTKCPRVSFERLDAIPKEFTSDLVTADDPAFALLHAWCSVGEDALREIVEVEEVLIDGTPASLLRLDECPLDIYQEGGQFTWYPRLTLYVDGILISAEDSVGGTTDAIMEEVMKAKWL